MLHMWDRGRMYLQKAGTIILATSIVLFICNKFPEKKLFAQDYDAAIEKVKSEKSLTDGQIALFEGVLDADALKSVREERTIGEEALESLKDKSLSDAQQAAVKQAEALNEETGKLENEKLAEAMEYTVSGRVGKFLEPMFRPIGFDWKLTTACIGALAAKEVFVSQLGIVYAEGEVEADAENRSLKEKLSRNYTPLQGFCIMLFCLLSIPCLATLAVVKRELNSWKMAVVEAAGLFLLAYVSTLIVYQICRLLNIGTKLIG